MYIIHDVYLYIYKKQTNKWLYKQTESYYTW